MTRHSLFCGIATVFSISLFFILCTSISFAESETQGSAGENITWTYDGNGTITFSGTGEMNTVRTWSQYDDEITTAIISEGITTISDNCFLNCKKLETVRFPDSLETIGEWAFSNTSLSGTLSLPKNIKTIKSAAFNTTLIEGTLRFPNSVDSIGSGSFAQTNINKIVLNDNIKTLGNGAFHNNKYLTGIVELPEGITVIPQQLFNSCINLVEVKMKGEIKSVGYGAFLGCTSLRRISDFSYKLQSIDADAFKNCSVLEKVVYYNIASINNRAFEGCSAKRIVKSAFDYAQLKKTQYTYSGKVIIPTVIVKDVNGNTLDKDVDYIVTSPSKSTYPNKYKVKIRGIGFYSFEEELPYSILKASNPMTVTTVTKAISVKKLKKSAIKVNPITVKTPRGTVTYKKLSGSSKLTVMKASGKVKVKKGTKKGIYKIRVKVSAAGNSAYKSKNKTVTVKVKVR